MQTVLHVSNDSAPCDISEPVMLGIVEDVTEPLVRVEREHGDVRVRMGKGGDVSGERGVVVDDVLLVERDVGRADMSRRPLERRHVEEEVRPAQIVGVCVFLRREKDVSVGQEEAEPMHTTAPKSDCISVSQKALKSS